MDVAINLNAPAVRMVEARSPFSEAAAILNKCQPTSTVLPACFPHYIVCRN